MSQSTIAVPVPTTTCDPATRVTRALLGYGVLAGPIFVGGGVAMVAAGVFRADPALGFGAAWGTVAFAATAALAWAWLSALSIHHHSR